MKKKAVRTSTELDLVTARRCVNACADYLAKKDDSPRAAADLKKAVGVIEQHAKTEIVNKMLTVVAFHPFTEVKL